MVFCLTSTRISHRYTHVSSLLDLPTLQSVTEPLFEFPESYSKFPLAICLTHGIANFYVTLSIHLPSPLLSPPHPSGLPQSTSFVCSASCIKLALVIYFTYGDVHVSMMFSQIIPPLPSLTESKSLFFPSVSPLLP